MDAPVDFQKFHNALKEIHSTRVNGKVIQVVGTVIQGHGPGSSVGALCDIFPQGRQSRVVAEVVGFRDHRILLMPLGDVRGIRPGSRIVARHQRATIRVGETLLGRVIDGLGNPIDEGELLRPREEYPIYAPPINPLQRRRIEEPLDLGIRAINGLLTCGKGQRIGILAGSGVGKSIVLGMIARYTNADVNVIALIGERGREVRDFIEKNLGPEGLQRSVVVAATSDQPPLIRMRGAFIATAIAEYFRSRGKHVLLMMDSVTRFAMALREIGLAIGEPPTTKGYTPSVFAMLPITGLYTVLVEGDDLNEPISDTVRSILDGHIVLSRQQANQNHYPAIDILGSVSRLMIDIVGPTHRDLANRLRGVLATYQEAVDLINIGAYVQGSNERIDYALKMIDPINRYLCQGIDERVDFKTSQTQLEELFKA
ncbi:MAG: FliI/YscN family ATPase [Candidatus Tectomicrobia bacterium]|uniref:FliI/YscN family ATPase n=1 Tax=Tectimicrobiota bacterium TaxID=2528274 RepID=A0A932LZG4_UNCTE|nr:FliI/YscN family ATPase [Candidatus Tectomicrobia bacterium]